MYLSQQPISAVYNITGQEPQLTFTLNIKTGRNVISVTQGMVAGANQAVLSISEWSELNLTCNLQDFH